MGKVPLFLLLFSVVTPLAFTQQTTDPNPGRSPDVFLDNHRPVKGKKDKAPTSRTVTGKVVDDTGQPLEGAIVILTDSNTNAKNTVFTKRDGRYNFDDVSFTVDYQLQARYKDASSEPRKLSQYDHTAYVVRILEIDPDAKTEAKSDKK